MTKPTTSRLAKLLLVSVSLVISLAVLTTADVLVAHYRYSRESPDSWNRAGHAIVARALASSLAREGILRPEDLKPGVALDAAGRLRNAG